MSQSPSSVDQLVEEFEALAAEFGDCTALIARDTATMNEDTAPFHRLPTVGISYPCAPLTTDSSHPTIFVYSCLVKAVPFPSKKWHSLARRAWQSLPTASYDPALAQLSRGYSASALWILVLENVLSDTGHVRKSTSSSQVRDLCIASANALRRLRDGGTALNPPDVKVKRLPSAD